MAKEFTGYYDDNGLKLYVGDEVKFTSTEWDLDFKKGKMAKEGRKRNPYLIINEGGFPSNPSGCYELLKEPKTNKK